MSHRQLYQAGAAAGVVTLVSFLVFMSGMDLQGAARFLLFGLNALSFLIFLSALTAISRAATAGPSWVPYAIFGGGLAAVTINVVQVAVSATAAREGLTTELHTMLHQLDGALFFASFFPLSILLLGVGISALRHAAFARWFGWASVIFGLLSIAGAVLGLAQDNGLVFILYLFWLLLACVGFVGTLRATSREARSDLTSHPQHSL